MHILIVEDDTAIADTLEQFIITEFRISCRIATTNEQAIKSIDTEMPKLILIDYLLSDGPCERLISHCKSLPHCPPIIILSAAGATAERCAAQHGIKEFLAKPFNLEELVGLIKKFLVD